MSDSSPPTDSPRHLGQARRPVWHKKRSVQVIGGIAVVSLVGVSLLTYQVVSYYGDVRDAIDFESDEARLTSVPVVGRDFFETDAVETPAAADGEDYYNPDLVPESDRYSYDGGATPELSGMDPDTYFISASKRDQIEYSADFINEDVQAKYDELNRALASTGAGQLGPLVAPSVDNTAQQIIDRHSLLEYITTTSPNKSDAKKAVASFNHESSNGFESSMSKIDNGTVVVTKSEVRSSSDLFYETIFKGTDPNGLPSMVIEFKTTTLNNAGVQGMYTFNADRHGGGEWVRMMSRGQSDREWVPDLRSMYVN
ncbi:hypothetical protein [Rhodococcus sp. P1Y]|uniref:hypothetical protein n=1 Tax=Rhodococcus sp. P1Y TaxID=1302308 RepID=UPI0012940020|nr:hypothetical protein [Rhodococcus sp. P1Y]